MIIVKLGAWVASLLVAGMVFFYWLIYKLLKGAGVYGEPFDVFDQ